MKPQGSSAVSGAAGRRIRLIRGGLVWDETGSRRADVRIDAAGRIEAVVEAGSDGGGSPGGAAFSPEEVLDASGLWLLPGAIDAHVHFRDPGLTHKEDFATGTRAAAAGGVTTVLDMPNTLPPVIDGATLAHKKAALRGRAHVDYGLFGAAVDCPEDERLQRSVAELVEGGVAGVKVFLGPTTGNLEAPEWGQLYQLLLRRPGTVFVFHCEDRSVIERARAAVPAERAATYRGLLESRPRFGELLATEGVLRLAAETGARVHVAHVALAEAVDAVKRFKEMGAPVSAETCPQYLFLTAEDYARAGALMKVLPPIREARDREALWDGLFRKVIDCVATDHAPHEDPAEDPACAWKGNFGMSGVQSFLPLLLDRAIAGACSVEDVVCWTSSAPARVFGLDGRKGSIAAGRDADIALIDPEGDWRLDEDSWLGKSRNTAFWGLSGKGKPVTTILRGCVVFDGGEFAPVPSGRDLFER